MLTLKKFYHAKFEITTDFNETCGVITHLLLLKLSQTY